MLSFVMKIGALKIKNKDIQKGVLIVAMSALLLGSLVPFLSTLVTK